MTSSHMKLYPASCAVHMRFSQSDFKTGVQMDEVQIRSVGASLSYTAGGLEAKKEIRREIRRTQRTWGRYGKLMKE